MTDTIAVVMRHCNNYFEREKVEGEIVIDRDGVLSPAMDAPYVAIKGSAYHDGVYRTQEVPGGIAERFHGEVWGLYPPVGFIALCGEIEAFAAKRAEGAPTGESFGGYSVSYGANAATWQGAFADRLRPYRRMFTEVGV